MKSLLPTLTHLDKVYWPEEGYTKGDLLAYYHEVAPVLVPHLRDRPQALHRHPDGIAGGSFFQKDVGGRPVPAWLTTARLPSEARGRLTWLLCQDEAALLYVANLGCIELNPWLSRVHTLSRPDYLVIDLDPVGVPFRRVIETALAVRKLFDRLALPSYCKTSGKVGLHIAVPTGAQYGYEQTRQFAELVAHVINHRLPETTSILRRPALRQERVYLDYLQNRQGATLAAPYSVRPVRGATVSTPLRWAEVRPGLDPSRFTMSNTPRRIDRVGDLWARVLGRGADLARALAALAD